MTNAAAAASATSHPVWAASASETPLDLGIEWDAENRLTRVCTGPCGAGTDPPNMLARFVYDGEGRRYQKIAGGTTRAYLYDGAQLVEERLSSGGTQKHFDGPGIDHHLASQDQAGAVSYYASDHLGSVTEVTTSVGGVREWDANTGLYYYRARYYDPKIGRFLSEDPIGVTFDSPNLYSYVLNNPVAYGDPFGLTRTPLPPPPPPCPIFPQPQLCDELYLGIYVIVGEMCHVEVGGMDCKTVRIVVIRCSELPLRFLFPSRSKFKWRQRPWPPTSFPKTPTTPAPPCDPPGPCNI